MNHCDILWVEDFDDVNDPDSVSVTNYTSDRETFKKQLKYYFPESYYFRVNIYKYFLKLLLHLEKEDNLSRYSCAVLDINLTNGRWHSKRKSDNMRPETEEQELKCIVEILNSNNVMVRPEHYLRDDKKNYIPDSDGNKQVDKSEFYKNAGYYLYLYLLQRGMPSKRICMLTANCDEGKGRENLSYEWSEVFNSAGLIAPKYYHRMQIKAKKNKSWIENEFFSKGYYRFRSCVVAMSSCLLDIIVDQDNYKDESIRFRKIWNEKKFDIESCKYMLRNLSKISLHISKEEIGYEYAKIIWQLVNPWEEKFEKSEMTSNDCAYYNLLKTTRNCLAHRDFETFDLLLTSFLFGLSLRGLFDFSNIEKNIEKNDSLKYSYNEYIKWENELLNLLEYEDKENNRFFDKEEDLSCLVRESFKDIFDRLGSVNNDIPVLIRDSLRRKDKIKYTDLLRSFLHGMMPIHLELGSNDRYNKKNFTLDTKVSDIANHVEKRYLESVRRTLQESIKNSKNK